MTCPCVCWHVCWRSQGQESENCGDRERETGRERERERERQGERERDGDRRNLVLSLFAVVRVGVGLNVISCLLTIKCVSLGFCVTGGGIRKREV
jgi:hypothetical protein